MTLGGTLFGVFSKLWWVRTAEMMMLIQQAVDRQRVMASRNT